MFCSKCGEKITDGAKFCSKCGESLGVGASDESLMSSIGATAKKTFKKSVSDDAPKPLAFLYEKFNCKDEHARKKFLLIAGLTIAGAFVLLLIVVFLIIGVQMHVQKHVRFRKEMDKIDREYEREMKDIDRMEKEWKREQKKLDEEWEKAKKKIREMPNPFD